ncbi:hypothetical protein [Serratia plymuthica]|nr:hypothetical protein [Serratia plymuthica]
MAHAARRQQKRRHCIAVIGDGALCAGDDEQCHVRLVKLLV